MCVWESLLYKQSDKMIDELRTIRPFYKYSSKGEERIKLLGREYWLNMAKYTVPSGVATFAVLRWILPGVITKATSKVTRQNQLRTLLFTCSLASFAYAGYQDSQQKYREEMLKLIKEDKYIINDH